MSVKKLDYLQELKDLQKTFKHPAAILADKVLNDPKFSEWSGSSKSHQHHYGDGGLLQHTYEVTMIAMQTADLYRFHVFEQLELFLAAVWHDYGKIWDYEKVDTHLPPNKSGVTEAWTGNDHRKYIRHLTRSAIEWEKHIDGYPRYSAFRDDVTHDILSHHGDFAGSPHPPQTKIAWILHLADNTSARITDAMNGHLVLRQHIK